MQPTQPTTRVSVSLSVPATFELAADGSKKIRYGGTAFTGNVVPDYTWDKAALAVDMESFQLDETGKTTMILSEHQRGVKLGTALAAKVGEQIKLREGKFFSTPDGQNHEVMMAEGAPFEFSIGFSGDAVFYKPGERPKRKLGGKTHEVGVEMFNARLHEVSLVTTGADRNTKVRQFSDEFLSLPDAGDKPTLTESPKMPEATATPPLDQKRIDAILAAAEAANARAEALEQQLIALTRANRTEKLSAKFGDKLSAEALKALSEVTEEAFTAVLGLELAAPAPTEGAAPKSGALPVTLRSVAGTDLGGSGAGSGTESVLLRVAKERAAKYAAGK